MSTNKFDSACLPHKRNLGACDWSYLPPLLFIDGWSYLPLLLFDCIQYSPFLEMR